MGIGGLALNFDGLTLQGVSLCGVVAVLLNLIRRGLEPAPEQREQPRSSGTAVGSSADSRPPRAPGEAAASRPRRAWRGAA